MYLDIQSVLSDEFRGERRALIGLGGVAGGYKYMNFHTHTQLKLLFLTWINH